MGCGSFSATILLNDAPETARHSYQLKLPGETKVVPKPGCTACAAVVLHQRHIAEIFQAVTYGIIFRMPVDTVIPFNRIVTVKRPIAIFIRRKLIIEIPW